MNSVEIYLYSHAYLIVSRYVTNGEVNIATRHAVYGA